jgi:two-component system, cell cycle response regulator CpdR
MPPSLQPINLMTPLPDSPADSPHRILVVEDDTAVRKFNTDVLTRSGYRVVAAEDGEAGWQAIKAGTYDLLITDNDMPKLSGAGLIKKVRSANMKLPVIMTSGMVPGEDFTGSPWFSSIVTLFKPYTLPELLRVVREALSAPPSPSFQTHTPE